MLQKAILAGLVAVMAVDIHTLVYGRFVQGVGGAAGPGFVRAIVSDSYDRPDSARMMAGIAGAIGEIRAAAGKASSVFGVVQVAFASALGFLVGLFYNDTLLPTAVGITVAMLISFCGYLIVRRGEGLPKPGAVA